MTTLTLAPVAGRAWRTLRTSRTALIGLAIVAVHVLIALLAPVLTSYDPIANDSSEALLGRAGPTGRAPTSTAGTSSPVSCTAVATPSVSRSPPPC